MLARIQKDHRNVLCPIVDDIDANTLECSSNSG